jgi:hypothetical protein
MRFVVGKRRGSVTEVATNHSLGTPVSLVAAAWSSQPSDQCMAIRRYSLYQAMPDRENEPSLSAFSQFSCRDLSCFGKPPSWRSRQR